MKKPCPYCRKKFGWWRHYSLHVQRCRMKDWNAEQLLDVIVNGPDEDLSAAIETAKKLLLKIWPEKTPQ